jgi:hypothetical protein
MSEIATFRIYERCLCSCKRKYGFGSFLFDIFMILITGGLWLIWIFVREMRKQY